MTEEEWLGCTDPGEVRGVLGGKASAGKLRLFACAYVRRAWHLLEDDRSQDAVEEAERFADGVGHSEDRELLCGRASEAATEVHDRRNERSDRASGEAAMWAAWAAEYA